jgi:hypothetical protein
VASYVGASVQYLGNAPLVRRLSPYLPPRSATQKYLGLFPLCSGHQGIIDGPTRRLQSSRNGLRGIAPCVGRNETILCLYDHKLQYPFWCTVQYSTQINALISPTGEMASSSHIPRCSKIHWCTSTRFRLQLSRQCPAKYVHSNSYTYLSHVKNARGTL